MIGHHIFLPVLIRWLDLVGMLLLIGRLIFRRLADPPAPARSSSPERLLPFFLLLIGLSDLALRTEMMSGQPPVQLWSFLPAVLFKSHFGKVWIVRMLLLCLLGIRAAINRRGRTGEGVALSAGAFLLLTTTLSGHAADSGDFSLAVLADWLHLLAASAWIGGLFFLASVLRKRLLFPDDLLAASIRQFSNLAAFCVALILATGAYQIWLEVGSLAALLQTPYGQTLSVKLFLVILLLGLGGFNRYGILPKLSRQPLDRSMAPVEDTFRRLLKTVTTEIGFGLAIFACVALLIQLPPARGLLANPFNASTDAMHHQGDGEPPPSQLRPAEGASVRILSPKEGQTLKGDEIPLHFKMTKGRLGSHVHAYVDGQLMGMFESEKGTLTGIQPGRHTLELRVVAKDHVTELNASDKVRFVLK